MLKEMFNTKSVLFLIVLVGAGYLCSKFPEESILIGGIGIVIVIGIWMMQLEDVH